VLLVPLVAVLAGNARADVVVPAEVQGLLVSKSAGDVTLAWTAVTQDATGQPETVAEYAVYRGGAPIFPLSFERLAGSPSPDLVDAGAASDPQNYFYLVTAVDDSGNEGSARPSAFVTVPALSGSWTQTSIELGWSEAVPPPDSYRIYYGTSSRSYEFYEDVGTLTSWGFTGLQDDTNYYFAVVARDATGIESALSNEHVDALAGTIDFRVHDESRLCPFDACPASNGEIQRRGGQEMMIPVEFPEGDWVNITLTYTAASNLCSNVPDKCGDQNPGWNPCGDPWDRTASVFLVLNDCIETGSGCYGAQGNLELIRTITPFGTDAPPPDGTGVVDPAVWTIDLTPYRPVLQGTKHVGAYIATWVAPGWVVSVDFHFSEDPLEASPKPPAAGVVPAWFRDGGNDATPNAVTIPSTATQVKARLFTTGHGGVTGPSCACNAQGRPCDEFCSKQVTILVDGVIRRAVVPTRTDCSPLGEFVCGNGTCSAWNACGCPSCTFNRSGWCPGLVACHQNEPCDQDLDATPWLAPGDTYDVHMDVRQMTPGASWANSLAVFWYE
jgi:hypothetical protein